MKHESQTCHGVVLVEDDAALGDATASALECFEFSVRQARCAADCFNEVAALQPQLVLLDLDLPDLPGDQICNRLRQHHSKQLPIIALSGCQDDAAIVRVLEAGADDFVAKSNSIPVLLAHIRAVLKRGARLAQQATQQDLLSWGSLKVDRAAWRVTLENHELEMTPTELRILEALLSNSGKVLTRDKLIEHLYGAGYVVTSRTIDVHVNGIRRHLGKLRYALETVRGVGYRFATDPVDSFI